MKLPITDQFLWDLYNFTQASGEITHEIFRRYRTIHDINWEENPLIKKYRNERNRAQFNQLVYRLKRNNYIKVKSLKENKAVILTKRGLDKALRVKFIMEKSPHIKRKDGKWTMIIFDIPEKRRKLRSLLRSILQNQGYKIFQQSVWITPYDVFGKTEELLQAYSLDAFTRIFLIEKIS